MTIRVSENGFYFRNNNSLLLSVDHVHKIDRAIKNKSKLVLLRDIDQHGINIHKHAVITEDLIRIYEVYTIDKNQPVVHYAECTKDEFYESLQAL